MNRRVFLRKGALGAGLAALSTLTHFKAKGAQMSEIRFDLGRNIVETAKHSGVPAFQSSNVDGLVSYSVNDVPPQVTAVYTRPGYEIRWQQLFAFTLRADKKRSPDVFVESATLQHRADFKSHAEAQAFVMRTLEQFKQGKWKRAFPGDGARLTGRSSLLDENGKVDGHASSPDPYYEMSPEDWQALMYLGAQWYWSGDGILATLDVSTTGAKADGTPHYSVALDFDIEKIQQEILQRNVEYENRQQAGYGVDIAARDKKIREEQEARNRRLEENAIKRGDKVLPKSS
ncbi:hypothetical protein [Achromobacter aloeverae]|uniref:Uncharacterized protein n=1 Tax=Achromobacter aloeverae TaxID=1750518 RepID=A0A4Q1HF89_9BURK|nr:hypothetical protein [Achromobacter aloeverae]RXN85208.1 hypothetical protein C7R54_22165 [Achromobacter aloeverae]